jgi:hypothetical protein
MRAGQAAVTFFTSLWLPGFFGIKGVRGVATVALKLNVVALFAESLLQGGREGLILGVVRHPFPGHGMPSLQKLMKFLRVTPGA